MVHRLLRDGSIASQRRIDPEGMREKKVRVKEVLNPEGIREMREVSNPSDIESLKEGGLGIFLGSQYLERSPLENPKWSSHLLVEETPMNGLIK